MKEPTITGAPFLIEGQISMKLIHESTEHHFLTTLDRLKDNAQGWVAVNFSLSQLLSHSDLISDTSSMQRKIAEHRRKGDRLAQSVIQKIGGIETGYVYHFCDNDVLVLCKAKNAREQGAIHDFQKAMRDNLKENCSEILDLSREFRFIQKLADQKMVAEKRFEAYNAMGDYNKTSSIGVRRQRRDSPVVMLVEDDRFTATYTSNILSHEYEMVVCKNGEEAISAYITHAPDIVFLDIHLPGLSGHKTLEAIKAIDPKAFIVMLSVDTAKSNITQAAQTGAKNFLKKPFSKERLLNVTRNSPYIHGRSMGTLSGTTVN